MRKISQKFIMGLLMASLMGSILATQIVWAHEETEARTFPDVPENHIYHTPIAFFTSRDIIRGYPDGQFRPTRILNRAESTKIIFLSTRTDFTPPANCYSDVRAQDWFSRYACWSPFIEGYGDGSFRAGNQVTFGETLKMMFVAFSDKYPEHPEGTSGPWYQETMAESKKRKFVRSNVDGREFVSRGEFMDMMYRFYAAYKDPSLTVPMLVENPVEVEVVEIVEEESPPENVVQGEASLALSQKYRDAFTLGLSFLENHLSSPQGGIYSNLGENYEPSAVVGVNHEILSESYGLALTATALMGKQNTYEKYYRFLDEHLIDHNKNLAYWKLKEDLTVYQYADAVIDDMRIIKGLLLGYEKFGVKKYRDLALAMGNVLKQHGQRNDILVSHVGWNQNDDRYYPAKELRLGYGDIATARHLARYDADWNAIADATQQVLVNGQYPSGLFHFLYKHDSETYEDKGDLETIFQAYTGEYLAEAGERVASQKLLNFFKNEWGKNKKIFNKYRPDGTPVKEHENIAVYGIVSRMAHHLGDRAFAEKLGKKLIALLINKPGSSYNGVFSWSEGNRIYAFNQGNALQTMALLGTTPSLPPPPPPVTPTNQFILWHMSDVYYGSYHDEPWSQEVEDMNTIPWDYALLAGDLSGDGSIQNFDGFLRGVDKSNKSRERWHIIAGNHEYNCEGSADDGCLDNYQEKIGRPLYYAWDYGNIHFIFFSPDKEQSDVKDSTFDWIRREVAANQDKIVILGNHHMPHKFEQSDDLLRDYGIDFWLFGHAHCKHGDSNCTRHEASGDFYQQNETTFVDAGYIGNNESRYIIFTEGSNQVTIKSRNHETGAFQTELEHTVTMRYPFRR